jgi:hypothetical protein
MIQNRVRTAATLILGQGEVLTLRLSGRPLRLACVAGRLWATTNRSAADHLLAPGEVRTFRGRGTVVVQALRIATARIELAPVTRALAVDASTPRQCPRTASVALP